MAKGWYGEPRRHSEATIRGRGGIIAPTERSGRPVASEEGWWRQFSGRVTKKDALEDVHAYNFFGIPAKAIKIRDGTWYVLVPGRYSGWINKKMIPEYHVVKRPLPRG